MNLKSQSNMEKSEFEMAIMNTKILIKSSSQMKALPLQREWARPVPERGGHREEEEGDRGGEHREGEAPGCYDRPDDRHRPAPVFVHKAARNWS